MSFEFFNNTGKFFKGNFLIEFGYNDQTEWDAHVMYRF